MRSHSVAVCVCGTKNANGGGWWDVGQDVSSTSRTSFLQLSLLMLAIDIFMNQSLVIQRTASSVQRSRPCSKKGI